MALNFPDSPTLNQVYTDTTSGFSYQWDGVVWQSYAPTSSSQIKIIDDISGSFNGSTPIFALTVSGVPIFPANAPRDGAHAGYFAAGGGSEDGTPGLGGDLIGIYNGSGGAGGNTLSGSDGNSGVFILRYEYTKN